MTPVFAKLNLKHQAEILVLDAPASFEPELQALAGVAVRRDPAAVATVDFALAFVTTRARLDAISARLADQAADDAVLWFAYPKASSKHYRCDFNRDEGWEVLHARGFDSVRQVAIDEDWSALRFRRTRHIGRATPKRTPAR